MWTLAVSSWEPRTFFYTFLLTYLFYDINSFSPSCCPHIWLMSCIVLCGVTFSYTLYSKQIWIVKSLFRIWVIPVWRESESHSVVSDSLQPPGLYSPWNSPGQNTGVGSLSLLQEIFPIQGLNPGLPHYRRILNQLSHKGSPYIDMFTCKCVLTLSRLSLLLDHFTIPSNSQYLQGH